MYTKRKSKTIAIIVASVVIIAGVVVFSLWGRIFPTRPSADLLQAQGSQIVYYMNKHAGFDFCTHISLEEQTDTDGNPYFVGKIDPELDAVLASLVDTYNTDPSTTKPITRGEVRYNLTEGIAEATVNGTESSAFCRFLNWCNNPADLVWKRDSESAEGIPHSAGDSVNIKSITNYDFVLEGEKPPYSDMKYSWE